MFELRAAVIIPLLLWVMNYGLGHLRPAEPAANAWIVYILGVADWLVFELAADWARQYRWPQTAPDNTGSTLDSMKPTAPACN